jgi:high-affinity iron transporter
MFSSLLITLREGLEAALIVGIIMSTLRQLDQQERAKSVWWGVSAATGVSVLGAIALNALGVAFEGHGEAIFEGIAMLAAAGVLTWMIFWMQRQAPHIKHDIERDVKSALDGTGRWALFGLAFVAVVREGIETALFLTAAVYTTSPLMTLIGGAIGLAGAVTIGYLIFVAGQRLNLKVFFRVTSLLLLLVAAGLLAHGIHELQEAALLPVAVEHVWNVNPLIDENGALGQFLGAMFGYNGNPSLLETLAYAAYFVVVGWFAWRSTERGGRRRVLPESGAG